MSYANGSLTGKTVILTGASSGIGAAIARAMASEQAQVVLVGRDHARLRATEADVHGKGARACTIAIDITADHAPREIVDGALAAFGGIDVLVHCAGIFEPVPFEETTLASLDRQWAVNLRAPFALTQVALPHLRAGSSVILVTSIAGNGGFPNSAAYCATKGAGELLVRSLGIELAPRGIRVNAVAPGNIHTPMNAWQFEASAAYEQSLIDRTPAGKIGDPDEIAPTVVFLASDAARFVYGASLAVDGGWTAG